MPNAYLCQISIFTLIFALLRTLNPYCSSLSLFSICFLSLYRSLLQINCFVQSQRDDYCSILAADADISGL